MPGHRWSSSISHMVKKGLIKLAALIVIIIALNFITRLFFTDYTWGDDVLNKKRTYLLENRGRYNAIFLGSSLTNYHIIPPLFDSLVTPVTLRSFNMGTGIFTNPEVYYIGTRLTGHDAIKPRYLFIELHNVLIPKKDDWHKVRFKYIMDLPTWSFAFNAMWHQKHIDRKAYILKNYTAQFLEHTLNMDLPVNYLKREKGHDFPPYYRIDAGFISAIRFPQGRDNFDSARYERSWSSWRKEYAMYKDEKEVNAVELKKVHDLIRCFREEGIHVIYILPPKSDYSSLQIQMGLFNNIPAANKINMADPFKFPEFYHIAHAHDRIHMNMVGARLYTQRLAEEFNRLVMTQHLE